LDSQCHMLQMLHTYCILFAKIFLRGCALAMCIRGRTVRDSEFIVQNILYVNKSTAEYAVRLDAID
jgi:hypothetical protein